MFPVVSLAYIFVILYVPVCAVSLYSSFHIPFVVEPLSKEKVAFSEELCSIVAQTESTPKLSVTVAYNTMLEFTFIILSSCHSKEVMFGFCVSITVMFMIFVIL